MIAGEILLAGRRSQMRGQGFTLIEITMVLVIFVLMCMVVVPQALKCIHAWDLEKETRQLIATIREVRERAITNEKTYQIVFLGTGDGYTIQRQEGLVFVNEETYAVTSNVQIKVTLSSPMNVIQFDKFGAPATEALLDLAETPLGHGSSHSLIQVEPVTGRVRIE